MPLSSKTKLEWPRGPWELDLTGLTPAEMDRQLIILQERRTAAQTGVCPCCGTKREEIG